MVASASRDTICVSGIGLACSLGLDAVTACAAARAGLVRAAELDYFPVVSPVDGSLSSLTGHPLPEVTQGFEGFARLLRITDAALTDLERQVPEAPWASAATGFYFSLPDPRRRYTGTELIADQETRQEMVTAGESTPAEEDLPQRLLERAVRRLGWPREPTLRFAARSGHTGVAQAFQAALDDLRAERVVLAIVAGVDSLLEEDTLAWLEATGRLKTPSLPVGVPPGEAGAVVLLERADRTTARHGTPLAGVQAICFADEPRSLFSGQPPLGESLARLLRELTPIAGWGDALPVWLLTDQNGEVYRAQEWGHALARLVGHAQFFSQSLLWYPAASVGDTGAASGAVALCLAIAAWRRGYAPAPTAAIVSAGDGLPRAVILLRGLIPGAA